MNHRFHLIFHIGAGKTGTSSIQASLSQQKALLNKHGWDYWGLLLEQAPEKKYDWQLASGAQIFRGLTTEQSTAQVADILSTSIDLSIDKGIHTAIWSNEFFFGRHFSVIPALKLIEAKNVKITIVAYVRDHASWAKSAFIQWSLKHKTYPGPIIGFKEYTKKHPVRFWNSLNPWKEAFPESFILRNFDQVRDSVSSFCSTIKIPTPLESTRVNETPINEELILRALFNNSQPKSTLPVEFDRLLLNPDIRVQTSPSTWLTGLMPSQDDIEEIISETSEDREAVNTLLGFAQENPLSIDGKQKKDIAIDAGTLCVLLAQIVFKQNRRINQQQAQIKTIMEQLTKDPKNH